MDTNGSVNENGMIDSNTSDNSTNEIDTIYGKKLRVTCVERKYKVVDQKASFFIVSRKEFEEDTTGKMLHEDMDLKTFLANYEIADITFSSYRNENIRVKKRKMPEMEKLEIGKKEESEATKKRRDIIMATLKRRELFDSLDLPEEFLVKDYVEAIEKNGIKISNPAMPYDDLGWLTKKGKVELVKKTDRGVTIYRTIRKTGTDKVESKSESDQSKNLYDKALLPSKHSIDKYISPS